MTNLATTSLTDLEKSLQGRVVTPGSDDYDDLRRVFVGDVDRRPQAVVRVASADDVARTVTLAREAGLELAVRCGGHSGAGHSATDEGIVLDLRDLNSIDIDPTARTVATGGGLAAVEVTRATTEHGLAVGFGDTGSVGIGGITTGGGIGYLGRKHGLTIDSLLSAEVVTADGEIRHVDPEHEPDLFWAIRGGGGNFGVVTRFTFRMHDVSNAYGFMLILPASAEVVEGFVAAAEAAPEEVSTIANVMPAPPMPFLAEEQHGKMVILAFIVHVGDPSSAEQAVAPFRALATPLADMLQPMSYVGVYPPEDEAYRPMAVQYTTFYDRIDRKAAETVMEHLQASDATLRAAQLRVLGGAIARVPVDATAYAHRTKRIMAVLVNFYDGTPEDRAKRRAWVNDFRDAMPKGDGAYVNFVTDEGPARVHEAYPGPTWDRLVALKRQYDPDNVFRLNQNIPPG
jgi:FAD/FMN-containing dehydrogenase